MQHKQTQPFKQQTNTHKKNERLKLFQDEGIQPKEIHTKESLVTFQPSSSIGHQRESQGVWNRLRHNLAEIRW